MSSKTPPRIRGSIKKDRVDPQDYMRFNFRFACEDCSHFDLERRKCTIGYNSHWHQRQEQTRTYILNGKMALCRFMEID